MSRAVLLATLVVAACSPSADREGAADTTAALPVVVLETSLGSIVLELEPRRAPETVGNFLRHVRAGFYDGLTFHRILPGFVIQSGQVTPTFQKRTSNATAIDNEAAGALSNRRGTVAMARAGSPHSAIAEFYINLADNASRLDFRDSTMRGWGYTAFGRVIAGMNVVDSIGRIRTRAYTDYPAFPVEPPVIARAYVR